MSARSTGVFPREDFNLDAAFEIPYNSSGTPPVTLGRVRTLRVTVVGYRVTGNATVVIDVGSSTPEQLIVLDSTMSTTKPLIFHIRGFGRHQEMGVTPFVNSGSITPGKVYVECVDGPMV